MEITTLNEWFCATLRAKLVREILWANDYLSALHNQKKFLASLEVEGSDGSGKDNTKQDNKANMPNSHIRQKAIVVAKVLSEILTNLNFRTIYVHIACHLTKLWCD